ncbi:MAG: FeoB-associated Cys-rich membrane protein [Clostridia bacterium]|nr:FeoB-associated Cys-rich membrane protein [Clostridia bacterium]
MELMLRNIGTLAVLAIVAVVVGIAVFSIMRDKKKGVSSCGNSCSSCPMSGKCHSKTSDQMRNDSK